MPFPLAFEGLEIPGLQALGFVIAADLAAGGGTVRVDARPEDWLPELATHLSASEVSALVHTLLAYPHPPAVALGAHLAVSLQHTPSGPLLVSALLVHDLGLLLSQSASGQTLEEVLGRAAANLCDLSRPELRQAVLAALEGSGIADDELARLLA
jgi:hypothetical protein